MSTAFDTALTFTLRFEGGLADNPNDPGGLTNFGISQRQYPKLDIRALTREDAARIYRRDYWDGIHGDELPEAVAVALFDGAVNCGVGEATRWLQQSLGVATDGIIGPRTMEAATAADPLRLAEDVCWLRLERYFQISAGKLEPYLRGWLLRTIRLRQMLAGV